MYFLFGKSHIPRRWRFAEMAKKRSNIPKDGKGIPIKNSANNDVFLTFCVNVHGYYTYISSQRHAHIGTQTQTKHRHIDRDKTLYYVLLFTDCL